MSNRDLFDSQGDLVDQMREESVIYGADDNEPVVCLGQTFANDAERRAHFRALLAERLQDPAFRQIEGFPLGEDEDILNLSDPPYYTACPNPWIAAFIAEWEADKVNNPNRASTPLSNRTLSEAEGYHREPFAADVSEGKNDPIYNAHSYHTKVPHKAIMRYILHYTQPGDIVFDGFCGTGMTGVAAQMCGDQATVESLGYQVQKDGTILQEETDANGKKHWVAFSKLGARRAVLNDLSPAATFIAYNYNTPVDVEAFEREAKRILAEVEAECGWMYETTHTDGRTPGTINYTVWSEVFNCPHCGGEIIYFDAAVDKETFEVTPTFHCSHCAVVLDKKSLQRQWQTYFDEPLQSTHQLVRYAPVLINYQIGKSRYEKKPDEADLEIVRRIDDTSIPDWFPVYEMLDGERKGKDGYHLKGISHLHHFYFRRAMLVYADLWQRLNTCSSAFVRFFTQGNNLGFTKMNRYQPVQFGRTGGSQVNRYFSGTLFVGSLISEVSPAYSMTNKLKRLCKLKIPTALNQALVTCQSTTNLESMPDASLDYIFIDPPFGNNLHYSELNFFWEAWLNVLTARDPEAVMDNKRSKTLHDYQVLMAAAFRELYRLLKAGHWITIEFHNSRNSVWVAIQEALEQAGFVVADVRTLDKQQETYKQSIQKLVKQDLVISGYKPNGGLEERFKLEAGSEEGVWDFVRTHLRQLPIFAIKDGKADIIVERMNYMLYDRMLAFHIRRNVMIPINSSDFYAGLEQRFAFRDDMYFLPEQTFEFDNKRQTTVGIQQINIFISDEASAIQWLKQALKDNPQSLSDLHPDFVKKLGGYSKNEQMLELQTLLEQNFICLDNLWYIPDPNKAGDLEKLRERALLKEFDTYKETKKKLKVFRLEAVRAGFKKAWQERDYPTIIRVAEMIPPNVLEEDPKLLMWYDQAQTRYSDSSLL